MCRCLITAAQGEEHGDRIYVVFRDVATGRVPLQRGSSTRESTDEQSDENGTGSVFGEGGYNLI